MEKIYQISSKLKYPRYFIDIAFNRAKKTFYSPNQRTEFNLTNILKLPYDEKFLEIPKILKLFNITVVFSNSNVKNIIIKNSPHNSLGCVYEIPCKTCNKRYYGQTSKALPVRIQQHKYSVRNGQTSNALFVHMRDFDHPIDWDAAKPLIRCTDFVKRNILESSIIKSCYDENLNLSQGLYRLDEYSVKKIIDRYKLRD